MSQSESRKNLFNGKNMDGWLARGAMFEDEAATGPLLLQGDHGPVAYRNLFLKRLPPLRS